MLPALARLWLALRRASAQNARRGTGAVARILRLLPPVARWAAAGFLIPLLVASVAFAALPSGRPAHHDPSPADATGPAGGLSIPPGEFAAFARARQRPPASAPIERLPTVDLAEIKVGDIPPVAAAAYLLAAKDLAATEPGCRLPWWLLAGIGYVESGHAASGGSWRRGWNGVADPPIYGPLLDGSGGYPAIPDSDHGLYDPPSRWDRAVGPMQFLPSTWASWGADGDRDGRRNPQDIWDAALAAGGYLCASAADLSTPQGMAVAVYSYNHSFDYVRLVLTVAAHYAGINPDSLGVASLPTDPSPSPSAARTGHQGGSTKPAASRPPSPTPTRTGTVPSPSPKASPPAPSTSPSRLPTPTPLPSLP